MYSLDFDKQYDTEEKYLVNYDVLNNPEPTLVDVRSAGHAFWPHIIQACQQKDEILAIEKKIQEMLEDQTLEGKESLIKQLEDSKPRPVEKPNYALKLDEERKVHLLLWGPQGCGKTQLAKGLAKRHERGIINMSEIFDWNIAHKTDAAEKGQTALEMRKEAIDAYIADKEKERKKKKLKKGEE
jgi:hypothetical protein